MDGTHDPVDASSVGDDGDRKEDVTPIRESEVEAAVLQIRCGSLVIPASSQSFPNGQGGITGPFSFV